MPKLKQNPERKPKPKKLRAEQYKTKLKAMRMKLTARQQMDNYITTGVQKPNYKQISSIKTWEDRNRDNIGTKLNP